MASEMTCPLCEARGVLDGECTEVVPQSIRCGHCRKLFRYQRNVWDHIRHEYTGQFVYLRITKRPPKDREPQPETEAEFEADREKRRQARLKGVNTRMLLGAYKRIRAWAHRERVEHDHVHVHYSPFSYTATEVKVELATREHVPNKQEAKALRRAKAQGRA